MPFKNNNVASGLSETNPFQVGRSNTDDNRNLEYNVGLPWAKSGSASYLYYDCTVGVMLDSGIAVHNRLPQVNNLPDTLSSMFIDDNIFETITDKGVNLKGSDQYTDIVQRMGHSRYWFRMWGQALRIGYTVPIPGMKTIGGVPAIPYDMNPQWGFNRILPGANYSGLVLWHAQWSLWYTTLVPPNNQNLPAIDLMGHITGEQKPPSVLQVPYSQSDSNAIINNPLPPGGPVGKPRI